MDLGRLAPMYTRLAHIIGSTLTINNSRKVSPQRWPSSRTSWTAVALDTKSITRSRNWEVKNGIIFLISWRSKFQIYFLSLQALPPPWTQQCLPEQPRRTRPRTVAVFQPQISRTWTKTIWVRRTNYTWKGAADSGRICPRCSACPSAAWWCPSHTLMTSGKMS